jgi:hypothetical protein
MRFFLKFVFAFVFAALGNSQDLGTAASFAVLGAQTVTNTGDTILYGDLGVYPGTSITGFPPGIVVVPGVIDDDNAVAESAQADALNAYNVAAGLPSTGFRQLVLASENKLD